MRNIWTGPQIKLRAIEESDKDQYFTYPEGSVYQKFYDEVLFPASMTDIHKKVEQFQMRQDDAFFFIIEDRKSNDCGHICVYDCNRRNGTFKYGIEIRSEFWRHGYASEAIALVLNYYMNYLRYHKAVSMVYSFNTPSLALHQKFGFVKEGQLRDMIYSDGAFYDLMFFGMTQEEFNELYHDSFRLNGEPTR